MPKLIHWKEQDWFPMLSTYRNDPTTQAVMIIPADPELQAENEIVSVSRNLSGVSMFPPPGHTFIKDYSELDGILPVLIAAGVLADTGQRGHSGYAEYPLCKILITSADCFEFPPDLIDFEAARAG